MQLSVIIPVFRVEATLRRCVESVLAGLPAESEVVLVDDGSDDRCPALCDEWAGRDERIRVVHRPNGGLSDARNYGLDRMKGDYVSFIDSDDYVGPDYLKILMDLIKEYAVPVAAVTHLCVFNGETSFVSSNDKEMKP